MSNQQPYGLHLKWLGVTCFEIKFGQTTAVTDPYITESPTSDLTWEGIEDCSIITLSHSHWEHNTDSPGYWESFLPDC